MVVRVKNIGVILVFLSLLAVAKIEDKVRVTAIDINAQTITLRVATGGCTRKKDFVVKVAKSYPVTVLEVIKVKKDRCKGLFPSGTTITFTRQELGIDADEKILVINPA